MAISKFKSMLDDSKYVVFFGGAGVSTESGIPDFRSASGVYSDVDESFRTPEEIISWSYFLRNPEEFYSFYKSKMIFEDALPNPAHKGLAKLEAEGKLKAVITQNIDGLHQMAGSENVLELHGSIYRNYCMKCKKDYELKDVVESPDIVPLCEDCSGIIRPDVVLYEESLDNYVIESAMDHIRRADMLIVGGTSLIVNPAASLVGFYRGDKLVIINKSPTSYDNMAELVVDGSIGEFFEDLMS